MTRTILKDSDECICYATEYSGFSVCGVICPAHMERAELTKFSDFLDQRPLTDETLEELGFEKEEDGWHSKRIHFIDLQAEFIDGEYWVYLDDYLEEGTPRWKTVGSVKMLIEALKGDE